MADDLRARSPLAHLGLLARRSVPVQTVSGGTPAAGVILAECGFRRQVALRGDADDPAFGTAVAKAGLALPSAANTVEGPGDLENGPRALWLGPDEWLVVAVDSRDIENQLRGAFEDLHAAVADVSDSRAVLSLSGGNARDVLAKGCPLDFHPRVFGEGQCAQSHLGKAHILIHQISAAPEYELYVHRSFADYLWRWLEDAAGDYGVMIVS